MTNELFYCTDVDAVEYGLDTAIVSLALVAGLALVLVLRAR